MCEVLEIPGERKERWLYLRAALSSTIDSIAIYYAAIFPFIQVPRSGSTADYLDNQVLSVQVLDKHHQ
jgi:hypothetical protein